MIDSSISIPVPTVTSTALMIHKFGSGKDQVSDIRVTRHAVLTLNGKKHIGAGIAMSTGDLDELLHLVANHRSNGDRLLPPNILGAGSNYLCWYVPGAVKPMWFLGKKGNPVRHDVPWPNLIMAVKDGVLSVASYKGRSRPHARTPLYHAPIGNVDDYGRVCTGSATLPRGADIGSVSGWESVIFDTMFSHVNHDNTLNMGIADRKKGVTTPQHLRFWRNQVKATTFPNSYLVPMGRNLGAFA